MLVSPSSSEGTRSAVAGPAQLTPRRWLHPCSAAGKDVRLKHRDTGRFLHSHTQFRFTQRNCPNCPIIGEERPCLFVHVALCRVDGHGSKHPSSCLS